MADGRRIQVPHRDFISHSPSGRTVIVEHEDDTHSILDPLFGGGGMLRTKKTAGT
jgi:hypothetical protein